MAREIKIAADEAISALRSCDFSGQVSPDTYFSKTKIGDWEPLELPSSTGKLRLGKSVGGFKQTGTKTELVALRDAATKLAVDPNVRMVQLEVTNKDGVDSSRLTIGRQIGKRVIFSRIALTENNPLNGEYKTVKTVLGNIPGAFSKFKAKG